MGFLILAGLSFLGLVTVDAGIEFLRQRKASQTPPQVLPPDSDPKI